MKTSNELAVEVADAIGMIEKQWSALNAAGRAGSTEAMLALARSLEHVASSLVPLIVALREAELGGVFQREVDAANAAVDAKERSLDEHGYGGPRPEGEIVGLAR